MHDQQHNDQQQDERIEARQNPIPQLPYALAITLLVAVVAVLATWAGSYFV